MTRSSSSAGLVETSCQNGTSSAVTVDSCHGNDWKEPKKEREEARIPRKYLLIPRKDKLFSPFTLFTLCL
jgi:hypothetical protein